MLRSFDLIVICRSTALACRLFSGILEFMLFCLSNIRLKKHVKEDRPKIFQVHQNTESTQYDAIILRLRVYGLKRPYIAQKKCLNNSTSNESFLLQSSFIKKKKKNQDVHSI